MNKRIVIIAVTAAFLLISCSGSYIYNPSLNLAPEALKKDQFQLTGEAGMLPESRPAVTHGKGVIGCGFMIR